MSNETQQFSGTRHRLTGQVVVLPQEEMESFDAFIREMVATFNPETRVELQLAQSWATYQWRINRAAAMEETLLTLGNMEGITANLLIDHPAAQNAVSNAKTFRDRTSAFAQLSMHSHRLVAQAEKVFKQLLHLQATRKQRQEKETTEAARVYRLNRILGIPFDPKELGFTVTLDQIKAHVRRINLREEAAQAEELNYDPSACKKHFSASTSAAA